MTIERPSGQDLDQEIDAELRALFRAAERPAAPPSLERFADHLPVGRSLARAGSRPFDVGLYPRPRLGLGLAAAVVIVAVIAGLFGGSSQPAASPGESSSPVETSTSASASPSASPTPSLTASASIPAAGSPSASTSPTPPPGLISNEQAQTALETFLGHKLTGEVTFGEPQYGAVGWWVDIHSQEVHASVLLDTGHVETLLYLFQPSTKVKLTAKQAQTVAATWLTTHGVPFDGMQVAVELVQKAENLHIYHVTWQRYVNGAKTPDMREVQLDTGTGQVINFLDSRSSIETLPSPVFDRDAAMAKARAASGLETPRAVSVELIVAFWPTDGTDRLSWSVEMDNGPQGIGAALVYVDALTGETLVVGRG